MNTRRHASKLRGVVVALGALAAFTPSRAAFTQRRPSFIQMRPPGVLAYGSPEDVADILRANGVTPAAMHCVNPLVGGQLIRAIACTTRLSPADVATLTERVPLAPATAYSQADTGDCEHTAGLRARDRGVVVYEGRNTRVPNGIGPILVHVVPATGAACVEVHVPWG